MLDKEEALALGRVAEVHYDTIINALEVYAERMRQAAAEALAEFDRGAADPEVRRQQDRSLISNFGYKQSAHRFQDSAGFASLAARQLREAMEGDIEDVDEDEEER